MTHTSDPVEASPTVLGIDVAKATCTIHDLASRATFTCANTKTALRKALRPFRNHTLAVCETTGGYERCVLDVLYALGVPACRADASRIKAFIKSHGGRAKTDPIDARWIARYGAERSESLPRWTPQPKAVEALAAAAQLRADFVDQRAAAKNRLKAPTAKPVRAFIALQIRQLDRLIAALDRRIDALFAAAPDLNQRRQRLQAITAFGPVVATTLIALVPELGSLSRRGSASLTGLAPHPRDSGQTRKPGRISGGRARIKPLMFMAAMVAARRHSRLSAFYQRLIQAGKPKRLALAAVARKLVVIANAALKPPIQELN